MMGFECPATLGDENLRMTRPVQNGWQRADLGPNSSYWDRTFWTSHMSQRRNFQFPARVGFDLRDNYMHRRFHQDITTKRSTGDHRAYAGNVYAGALTHVPPGRADECGGAPLGDMPPAEMLHRSMSTSESRWSVTG